METILTKEQQKAYSCMEQGKNIFLTGPSGTGKSMVIHMFNSAYGKHKNIAITSTTGISALLIGGSTLHSYLGIGLGTGTVEQLITKINKNKKIKSRWTSLDVLVIDEVSMLSPELFDKLEEIARVLRRRQLITKQLPFGGIQLILSGDFLQLPVVKSDDFCFEAKSWDACVHHTVELTEIIRQTDPEFQNTLNNLRYGRVTREAKMLLNSRINTELKNELGIIPTRIFTTNAAVDEMNEKELDSLGNLDFYEYNMEVYLYEFSTYRNEIIERCKKNCLAPEKLQLCVGAQVMLLYNMDLDCGLANGSRGVIIGFMNDLPQVRFLNGEERVIDYHDWETEEDGKKQLRITQLPLKLAWAITVHKCVNGNTILYTENGMKRIKGLIYPDQKSEEIKELNMFLHSDIGLEKCDQIYRGKVERSIKITTERGYILEGSYRHPVYTYSHTQSCLDWKLLPDINNGDYVCLRKGMKCTGQKIRHECLEGFMDNDICYLLGVLLSRKESSINNMTVSKEEVGEKIEDIFSRLFTSPISVGKFLKWCQIDNCVPWVILENTMECQISFLKGIYDNNGTCIDSCIFIYYLTHRIASDIQSMLLNLGIVCSCTNNDQEKKYDNHQNEEKKEDEGEYMIKLSSFDAYKFCVILGINDISNYDSKEYRHTIMEEISKIDRDNLSYIHSLYYRNLFLDKVVSISYSECEMYDIHVPDKHAFIGNGFVNHNSQGCTLDYAEVDLSNIFTYGQGYVALSRVKSKEGLSIIDIDYDKIQAHPKALKYYSRTTNILSENNEEEEGAQTEYKDHKDHKTEKDDYPT